MMLSHLYLIKNMQPNASHIVKRKIHQLFNPNGLAFVNGKWIKSTTHQNDATFEVYDPTTECAIGTVPNLTVNDLQSCIDTALCAFRKWSNVSAKERGIYLRKWYQVMSENTDSLAQIVSSESGKPYTESVAEVTYGNSYVEFYAEEARRIHGDIIESPVASKKMLIERQPVGVAALITPWNFPHAMIARKAAAALAAGCTCIVKPAEDTPFTALAMAKLAEIAGLPNGLFNVVTTSRANAAHFGQELCTNPKVAAVSFTGSTQVGHKLYSHCADGIKRIALELGGSAPFIVYESANIKDAIRGAITSKFRNCGQACIASNLFLIQNSIYDEFVAQLLHEFKHIKFTVDKASGNNPSNNCTTFLGPLINKVQFDKVESLVQDAIDKGATVLMGGKSAPDFGALFYQPTIIQGVTDGMRLYREEVFGPVISLVKFANEEESLQIANGSDRGLAGYFYSQNVSQIFRVSRALQVGMCGVNEGSISAAEAPFGGVKLSGIGREGSKYGLDEFTFMKYICIGNLK